MKVTVLAPVAAEVSVHPSPRHASLVVKATFRLGSGGWSLADYPLPLEDDVPLPRGAELYYARDRVPSKGRADVLVVGHAKATQPTRAIAVRIAIAEIDKRCFACAAAPAKSVPLTSTYLRASADGGDSLRVGPSAGGERERFEDDAEAFNVAPVDQRAACIAPGAVLRLGGLLSPDVEVSTTIPTFRPTAFGGERLDEPSCWQRIPLVCDTLWIDVDERLAALIWRAHIPTVPAAIVVGGGDQDLSPADLARRLAVTTGPTEPTLSEGTTELDLAELARDGATLPFVRGERVGPPPSGLFEPSDDRSRGSAIAEETAAMEAVTLEALPFAIQGRAPAQPTPSATRAEPANLPETTTDLLTTVRGETLPFLRGLPVRLAPAADPGPDEIQRGATLELEVGSIPTDDLPFARRLRAPLATPRVVPPSMARPEAVTTAPRAQPLVEDAPSLSLDTHAAVKAALLDGKALRSALEALGIGERDYRLAERRLAIDLAREAAAGRSELSRRLEAAIVEARRRRPADEATRSLEDDLDSYVMARAEVEEADDPRRALAALGLSAGRWAGLRQHWTRRALVDPSLAAAIRERLAEARRGLRRVHSEPGL